VIASLPREIENPVTGEEVRFIRTTEETAGELLVMEDRWPAGHRSVAHLHPTLEEHWQVIEGRATLTIAGDERELGPGSSALARPGEPHWGRCVEPVVMRVVMRPAGRWEDFARQLFALAGEELDPVETERSVNELLSSFSREVQLVPMRGPTAR
jgi:quercetin dioxygenase-like cupin family protein